MDQNTSTAAAGDHMAVYPSGLSATTAMPGPSLALPDKAPILSSIPDTHPNAIPATATTPEDPDTDTETYLGNNNLTDPDIPLPIDEDHEALPGPMVASVIYMKESSIAMNCQLRSNNIEIGNFMAAELVRLHPFRLILPGDRGYDWLTSGHSTTDAHAHRVPSSLDMLDRTSDRSDFSSKSDA